MPHPSPARSCLSKAAGPRSDIRVGRPLPFQTNVPQESPMKNTSFTHCLCQLAALAALGAAGLAHAGECPADQVGVNSLPDAPTQPVGITDTELSAVDLAKENVMLDHRRLRLR